MSMTTESDVQPVEDDIEPPGFAATLLPGFGTEYNKLRWSQRDAKQFMDGGRDWPAVTSFLSDCLVRGTLPQDEVRELQRPPRPGAGAPPERAKGNGNNRRVTYRMEVGYHGPAWGGFAWQKECSNTVEQALAAALTPLLAAGGSPKPIIQARRPRHAHSCVSRASLSTSSLHWTDPLTARRWSLHLLDR